MKINKSYKNWLLESTSSNKDEEIRKANYIIKSSIMWININMPFYAEILVNVSVFGSYSNPTMWTDCRKFIAFNPKYVCDRPEEETRFTIIHECLHIILQHDTRKGGRNHELWNIATDYAINGIIASDEKFKTGKLAVPTWRFDKPEYKIKKGEKCVYLDAKFDGMPAEDIYDQLLKDGWKISPKDRLMIEEGGDVNTEEPEVIPGTVVQEGPYEEEYFDEDDIKIPGIPVTLPDDSVSDPRQGGHGDEGDDEGEYPGHEDGKAIPPGMDPDQVKDDDPKPGQNPKGQPGEQGEPDENGEGSEGGGEGGIGTPGSGEENGEKPKGPIIILPGKPEFSDHVRGDTEVAIGGINGNTRVSRVNDKGDVLKGNAKEWKRQGKSKILKKVNWDIIKRSAFARHQGDLSPGSRKALLANFGDKPSVDWETELKKWYDYCLTGREYVIPNRRLVSSDIITYGSRPAGLSGLKIIVAAVDTSGSISEDQKKTFLNEVAYLAKKHNSDRLIIIYCSDDIDGFQIIKKGEKINLNLMKSTGGNAKGFIPPFQWLYERRIKPSVFIYLTDTAALMPDIKTYNIKAYSNKVIWFVCSTQVHVTPPFGKIIFMPVHSIKDDIKKGKHTPKL